MPMYVIEVESFIHIYQAECKCSVRRGGTFYPQDLYLWTIIFRTSVQFMCILILYNIFDLKYRK